MATSAARVRRALLLLAALCALLLAVPTAQAAPSQREAPPPPRGTAADIPVQAYRGALPLGSVSLSEQRTQTAVAPGVELLTIERGHAAAPVHTVDIVFTAEAADARAVARDLRADGYQPRVETIRERPGDAEGPGPQGYLVRVGAVGTSAEATALAERLRRDGYSASPVFTPEDGGTTTGPWVVHVLRVSAGVVAQGRVEAALARDVVVGQATLPEIAATTGALAAVNGGFFVVGSADGTVGQLAGISAVEGELVSEAVNGRTSLILPAQGPADVAALETRLEARTPSGTREVDGLNRKPGLIRGCGGVGGDEPTEAPLHDFTCTDDSELIHFTPTFGADTEPGAGVEVVLDSAATVTQVRSPRGGPIPADGSVLAATGDAVEWVAAHAPVGTRVAVTRSVLGPDGPLSADDGGIVNGGPRLVSGGAVDIPAVAEGFDWPHDPEFFYRWGVRRHPRTMAGTTAGGDLLLVAVDGRRPGHSVGANLHEAARILVGLGAVEGVNLDGGGSTTMTVGTDVVNVPSVTPLRPIADAVVVTP